LACGPFLIAGFVVLIVERQLLSWFAGMIFGVFVGVWLWLRDSPRPDDDCDRA
jgi:hypothetical protein